MFFIKIYIKESYMNYYDTSIQMCGQYCILAPAFYSKFVTTFLTDSAGHNLTHRLNPVSVVISLHVDCYGWYDWFPGFFIFAAFNPLNGGGIHGFSKALRSF